MRQAARATFTSHRGSLSSSDDRELYTKNFICFLELPYIYIIKKQNFANKSLKLRDVNQHWHYYKPYLQHKIIASKLVNKIGQIFYYGKGTFNKLNPKKYLYLNLSLYYLRN